MSQWIRGIEFVSARIKSWNCSSNVGKYWKWNRFHCQQIWFRSSIQVMHWFYHLLTFLIVNHYRKETPTPSISEKVPCLSTNPIELSEVPAKFPSVTLLKFNREVQIIRETRKCNIKGKHEMHFLSRSFMLLFFL